MEKIKGKISIEYTNKRGKIKYKPCKRDRDYVVRFTDGRGKANKSYMKVFSPDPNDNGAEDIGYSEISVLYPKINGTATGYIILDNKIALYSFKL